LRRVSHSARSARSRRMARAFRSLTLALALGSLAFGLGCAATTPVESFSSQASCCQRDDRTIAELIELAREGDPSAAGALRARGPAAHEALLARLDAAVGADRAPLAAALDRVAAQRDADVSRLYWYTDLEEAKRAAAGRGKPILSLRLLGRLDDELSCANSRFFRTTLYPNERVSKALRERFVLHWSSEREAPLVTIDFRDGRKVQRTVTGNSLHYVLDPQGRVLDAIPGLYTPEAFLLALADAEGLYAKTSAGPPGAFEGTAQLALQELPRRGPRDLRGPPRSRRAARTSRSAPRCARRSSSFVALWPGLKATAATGRSSHFARAAPRRPRPPAPRGGSSARSPARRADPLAAGLDDVLRAVGDAHVALRRRSSPRRRS
jgi:hypothetical protein